METRRQDRDILSHQFCSQQEGEREREREREREVERSTYTYTSVLYGTVINM